MKPSSSDKLIVGVYIDDLIVTGSRTEDVKNFKEQMKEAFEMGDLGSLSMYSGIEIDQRPACIYLSQKGYARYMLEKRGLLNCHSSQTSLEARSKFSKTRGDKLTDPTNFRSIVGSLRYLTHTRPDLLYSNGLLSRYMKTPTFDHLSAAKRILRYVKGTLQYGLRYLKCQLQDALIRYSDNDFAGDMDDRKKAPLGMSSLCDRPL